MRAALGALALLAALGTASQAGASPCTALNGLKIENSLVRSAEDVPAREKLTLAGRSYDDLPAFCRISATTGTDRRSNILVELWLPEASGWNSKLLGTGNGGFAGTISFGALAGGLRRGYAVTNTDMGTFPASSANWAAGTGQPEMLKDWGYRSTHEMTMLAKALTQRYYGRAPVLSYFTGCSTGGHQALMESQLYPNDYDAILAGAPANNRTRLHLAFLQTGLDVHATPRSWIAPDKLAAVHEEVLKRCAGKFGGAPGDRFLADPTQCDFKPREMICKPGQKDISSCLDPDQATALEKIYGGFTNWRTKEIFYPGWPLGSEPQLGGLFGARDVTVKGFVGSLAPWAMGAEFDVTKFDFDRDMDKVDRELGPVMNQTSPDLSAFAAHGGKLIVFHGLADAIVGPLDTINYYERIGAAMPGRESFARLYMAPGVAHCTGGDGPDMFGQGADRKEGDVDHDLLKALDAWRDKGTAPGRIIATKFDAAGAAVATRPLCPYPQRAFYKGGDAKDERNFACQSAPGAKFPRPAPAYLH
ncbi:MAG: tannase/feruloyl esterase family alpha/beta hydrolase [Alphaproteobacteria bacterium]